MRKILAIAMAASLLCVSSANAQDVLYDQQTDGTNGYSNFLDAFTGIGEDRWLLDDFEVTSPGWVLNDFHWNHIWNTLQSPSGFGLDLEIWSDNGGQPGGPLHVANITSYSEQATGNSWFSRPEMESWVEFDDIALDPGRYWFRASIEGPENNFWMVTSLVSGSESWADYPAFGGLQPGSAIFGVPADLDFTLTGYIVPEPTTLSILALGSIALVGFRRRR